MDKMENKIYCKNCSNFNVTKKNNWICIRKEKLFDSVVGLYIKRYTLERYSSLNNKNNNCKYYKRKWWKFWVK